MMNHRRIERVATLGRTPSFVVEDNGNLGAIETLAAKLGGARRQRRISAERREARNRTRQFVRRAASAMPMAFDANPFRAPDDLDQDPFEQQARDGLALGLCRGLGSPERRQVMRQLADALEFGRARRLGLLSRFRRSYSASSRACSLKAASQARSSVRATSRFSGSTAAYRRRARSTS